MTAELNARFNEQIDKANKHRNEVERLRALLQCVQTNLEQGMSKSIQRLQARVIKEELEIKE